MLKFDDWFLGVACFGMIIIAVFILAVNNPRLLSASIVPFYRCI